MKRKLKKIFLVTGVAGFIGSNVAKTLLEDKNIKVVGIDNLSTGYEENIPDDVIFYKNDCSDPNLKKILQKYKFFAILHFAGQSSGELSFEDPINDVQSNVLSTINLMQFCIFNKCKKFIYASTMSVYGNKLSKVNEKSKTNPISFYAVGKLASEKYLDLYKNNKVNISVLRLFNVYGPGQDLKNLKQGMVSIYLSQLIYKKYITVKGAKERFRDFVYIDDVVKSCLHIMKNNIKQYEIYNICTGTKTSVENLLNKLIKHTKIKKKIFYKKSTPGDQIGIQGDNSKLKKILIKNQFIDIDTGLKKTINYIKEQHFFSIK